MIVEEILGNIANLSPEEKQKHTEKVYLENSDLVKRIQRVKTDHGNEIGIRLKNPVDLQYGDILYEDDNNRIVVDVNSEDIWLSNHVHCKKWEILPINLVTVIYLHNSQKVKCWYNTII